MLKGFVPMAHVRIATAQVIRSIDYQGEIGKESKSEIEKTLLKAEFDTLPRGDYVTYIPVIGEHRHFLGQVKPKVASVGLSTALEKILKEYDPVIQQALAADFSGSWSFFDGQPSDKAFEGIKCKFEKICKEALEQNWEFQFDFIERLYDRLSEKYEPWGQQKAKILAIYKPIFSLLVKHRAQYDWLRTSEHLEKRRKFEDLLQYALDEEGLTKGFSKIGFHDQDVDLGDSQTWLEFKMKAEVYLPRGTDINALHYLNPKFGPYLNFYLAHEFPSAPALIEYIELWRKTTTKNAHFDYQKSDGFGNTPLLLAIRTRQGKVVEALLKLTNENVKIGIDVRDAVGRTPLMIAAAVGMQDVVRELLRKGADATLKDRNGNDFRYYANLNEEELRQIILPIIHPDRSDSSDTASHSYLYADDEQNSPICFYEAGEEERVGKSQEKHLVVLSNRSPHKEKLDKVVVCLEKEVDQGKASEKLLRHVKKQIDDIRFREKFVSVRFFLSGGFANGELKEILKNDPWLKKCLTMAKEQFEKRMPYEKILENIVKYFEEEIRKNKIDNILKQHQQAVKEVMRIALPTSSFLEKCQEGREIVQACLKEKELLELIEIAEQKCLLRRACALGNLAEVEVLLKKGVDPNATDEFGRTALHYAVMRFESVKEQIQLDAAEKGKKPLLTAVEVSAKQALEKHAAVIGCLIEHSKTKLNWEARDKWGSNVKNILERDKKESENLFTVRAAEECLEKFFNKKCESKSELPKTFKATSEKDTLKSSYSYASNPHGFCAADNSSSKKNNGGNVIASQGAAQRPR